MTCKIYFIKCLETGEIYIGSTKQKYLCQRISTHKHTQRKCSSIQILDRGNYVYDVLEEVDESHRYIREQYYIDNTDNCINRQSANGLNMEKRKEYNKEYYKQYYLDNSHKLKEREKQKYIQNRDKLIQKYTCECGSVLSFAAKSSHLKTKKHQNYIKTTRCMENPE